MTDRTWWVVCLVDALKSVIVYMSGDYGIEDTGHKTYLETAERVMLNEVWRLGPYNEEEASNLVKGFGNMPMEVKIKMLTEVPKGPIRLGEKS